LDGLLGAKMRLQQHPTTKEQMKHARKWLVIFPLVAAIAIFGALKLGDDQSSKASDKQPQGGSDTSVSTAVVSEDSYVATVRVTHNAPTQMLVYTVDEAAGTILTIDTPASAKDIDGGGPINIFDWQSKLCASYLTVGFRQEIWCRDDGGSWQEEPTEPIQSRSTYTVDVSASGSSLYLVSKALGPRGRFQVWEKPSSKPWSRLGRSFALKQGELHFVRDGSSSAETIGGVPLLTSVSGVGASARRGILQLDRGHWRSFGTTVKRASGPVFTGATIADRLTVLPTGTNTGSPRRWVLSARVRTSSTRPWRTTKPSKLNQTSGDAQGGIYAVDSDMWAVWQEDTQSARGIKGSVYVSRLLADRNAFAPVRTLWSGQTAGPSGLGLLKLKSGVFAVYTEPLDNATGGNQRIALQSVDGKAKLRAE
jgi:hypothetical protein